MAKLVLVNLDMNQNQLLQAVMQAGDAPANPTAGQFYYDSTKKHAYVYNGTAWELMGNVASVVDADFDASSTNAIQNKAVSTGLVKSLDSTSTDSAYTIKGKAANGSEITSVEIPGATKLKAGLLTATDKQNIDNINNKANKSEAIGNLTISGGTTISWTAVDGSSPEPDSITIPNATTTTAGAMSAADKNKLDGITAVDGLAYTDGTAGVDTAIKSGTTNVATATIPAATDTTYGVVKVDSALKTDSTNPVQNKMINLALGNKADKSTVNTLSGKVSTLESQMVSMPADISAMGGSTSYKLTLEDADGSTLGAGATINQATSTNVGVVKLDPSVTASGTNPVTGKGIYDYVGDAIAALPKEQFLDLTKTTFVQSFTWSSATYPGSTNPSLEGKPVLVLALKNSSDNTVTYSFLNMYELVDTYEADSPIKVSGRKITHETSGVSAGSYGQASNATPAFGDTFNVPYITENATGHATKVETHTVKIPDTVATSNQNGLMSTNDVTRLDYLTKHSIQKKTATLSAGSKVASITVSPEEQADIVQVLVTTPDNELVIADVTTDGSGSNVSVVIAQPYSANLTITIWYIVTE